MQVSVKWLKDYIDFDLTAEELADKLTMAGVPVENVLRADEGLDKVVTGKIEKITPHENSDHLLVCQIDIGAENLLQIVTGAQNVKEGQIVPVAQVGANLPNGQKIAKGKLRGVASNGMLCSAQELKLNLDDLPEEQKTGIYILPADTKIGEPAAKVLGLDDVVLEFELTANRGDCFSVYGIVREIAMLTGNEPKFPKIELNEDDDAAASDMIKIGIEDANLCHRFSARVIKNVKIAPSPSWMQERLLGAGIRAINNVVDVTNFVMVELGQPMHAYDYDEIKGHSLTARCAVQGENLHTLDDSSRLAKGFEIVIADGEKAAGLGGVMGGLETEVTDKTTTIVLEAASFDGATIRRAARGCGLATEASGRFERGVDVANTTRALDRAAELLQKMGACTVTRGIVDVYPNPREERRIKYRAEQINARLGTKATGEEIADVLKKLCFEVTKTGDEYEAKVPSWRNDVSLWEDLSEEFARAYGFDNIPATLPHGATVQGKQSEKQDFIEKIQDILAELGLCEELSFAFTNEGMFEKLRFPAELRRAVPIKNPLTDDNPLVRTSLLTGIIENALRNFARKNEDVRLFEIAPVFLPKALPVEELPKEETKLAGIISGRRYPVSWTGGSDKNDKVDFYDLKAIVESLLARLGIGGYTVERGEHFMLHPGKTAFIKKGREVVLTFGEVHPAVADNLDTKNKMYVFEADIKTLQKYAAKKFRFEHLPKYPAISRDLAIIADNDVSAAAVKDLIAKNGGKYFVGAELFDVYTGKPIEAGKKSLAYSITFRAAEKTLTDADADADFNNIVAALKKEFAAELRG